MTILLLPIHIRLLSNDEKRTDEPIETDSEREEVRTYSDRKREYIEHHFFHHFWIKGEFWHFSLFFLEFFLFFFRSRRLICERKLRLDILYRCESDAEDNSSHSSYLKEIKSIKVSIDRPRIKVTKEWIEMIEIRWIRNPWDHPVESYEYRHLDEKRKTWAHRIHSLFFIELDHLHTELRLVRFIFFLEFFDFGLDDLEFFLTLEHMMLRNEEDKSDNKSNDKDRPSKRMPGKEGEKRDEEVIYRIIDDGRKKRSECPRSTHFDQNTPVSKWCRSTDHILAFTTGKHAKQIRKRKKFRASRSDHHLFTKIWREISDTSDRLWIDRDMDISTGHDAYPRRTCIDERDFWDIRDDDSIILYRKVYIRILGKFFFWWEKILERNRENHHIQGKNDKLIHEWKKLTKIWFLTKTPTLTAWYFRVRSGLLPLSVENTGEVLLEKQEKHACYLLSGEESLAHYDLQGQEDQEKPFRSRQKNPIHSRCWGFPLRAVQSVFGVIWFFLVWETFLDIITGDHYREKCLKSRKYATAFWKTLANTQRFVSL